MKILLVDDEKNIRDSLARFFSLQGIETQTAENGFAAERLLENELFEAVVADLKMPGPDGLALLNMLRQRGDETPFIIISAHGEIDDAVAAIKQGAYDFIEKPFNPEALLRKIQNACEEYRLRKLLKAQERKEADFPLLIGESPLMLELKERLSKIGPTMATTLITGASGTGKEVVARELHRLSPVKDGPFLAVHCAAFAESLIESELFGYEKGAFTGAERRHRGVFELACGGTLFLDEIAEIPLTIQVKLLRVIQERKIMRIGGEVEIPVNPRLIAATNRDLEQMLKEGSFREDLYYRLNVARLHVPPLAERRQDIPLLVAEIIKRLNSRMGKQITGIASDALEELKVYPFQGNVRELENMIERAYIYAEGTIQLRDFEQFNAKNNRIAQQPGPRSLAEIEKEAIAQALLRWEGNRTRAAQELGISRQSLIKKIAEYGLEA